MNWDATKAEVIRVCGETLAGAGYKFVASRQGYEQASKQERRGVYINLVSSNTGNRWLSIWSGVRNNPMETIFHRTSGVEKRHQASYTTLNRSSGNAWAINTDDDFRIALVRAQTFITEVAMAFLGNEYSYVGYSDLLNSDPTIPICPFHGNPVNRCHYGLIAAKLSADPRYDQLHSIYSEYLRSTSKGFYYPRFQDLATDLRNNSAIAGLQA